MKAYLTKVSLALLSTVFLLGCQDMGSGPVGLGPEFTHKDGAQHGKGGGGGPKPEGVLVDVIVTGGMKTESGLVQKMELVRKGDIVTLRGLLSELGEPDFRLQVDMTLTYGHDELAVPLAPWRQDICDTGHGDTADFLMNDVFTNLLEPATEREVLVRIDTSALENGDHIFWVTNGPGLVKIAPSTVVIGGDIINTDVFSVTFGGGELKLGGTDLDTTSRGNKSPSQLFCGNLDEITVTVGGWTAD